MNVAIRASGQTIGTEYADGSESFIWDTAADPHAELCAIANDDRQRYATRLARAQRSARQQSAIERKRNRRYSR